MATTLRWGGARRRLRRAGLVAALAASIVAAAPVSAGAEEAAGQAATPAGAAAAGAAAVEAAASAEAAPAEAASVTSSFADTFTSSPGYATTAAESFVPGAMPVAARATDAVSWASELSDADAATGSLVVRQRGASATLYRVLGDTLVAVDAQTGAQQGGCALDAAAARGAVAVFDDESLIVPLAGGAIAAYDEELTHAWTSEALAAPAQGAWDTVSHLVARDGMIFAVWSSSEAAEVPPRFVAYAALDGSAMWSVELAAQDGAASASPQLVDSDTGLLVATGDGALRLIDPSTGALTAELRLPSAGAVQVASLGAGRYAVAGTGWVSVVEAADGALTELAVLTGDGGAPRVVTVVAGELIVVADAADGAAQLVVIDGATAGEPAVTATFALPAIADGEPLVVASGPSAKDAVVELYLARADGAGVCRVAWTGGDVTGATVDELALPVDDAGGVTGADVAATTMSLVADRTGAIYILTATGATVAFAPGEAAGTVAVGGSEGLDTIMGSFVGLTLPNGAGLGLGVLVFVIGFGAYAAIRNKGNRAKIDEGLITPEGERWDEGRRRRRPGARR